MKLDAKKPPREFPVGRPENKIIIKDCGSIHLQDNEQITFVTESGAEYDVCRKNWGFYATPSTNGRLARFGLRAALVQSPSNMFYIWLMEDGKDVEFKSYTNGENHKIICWLDDDKFLANLNNTANKNTEFSCICGSDNFEKMHAYESRPDRETDFQIPEDEYHREYWRCECCGHFIEKMDIDLDGLYDQNYADSTYGDKLEAIFEKIINLPEGNSDNVGRVDRIIEFAKSHFKNSENCSILDVGSGLCVFLHRVQKLTSWNCTALDPDPRQSRHARDVVGVKAVQADFTKTTSELTTYDIITFNKVLEHVKDPVFMLSKAKNLLNDNGFVYVELPDATAAFKDSPLNEEFFIEHYHVFSVASIALLGENAGLNVKAIERIRDPSGKFTLKAFFTK